METSKSRPLKKIRSGKVRATGRGTSRPVCQGKEFLANGRCPPHKPHGTRDYGDHWSSPKARGGRKGGKDSRERTVPDHSAEIRKMVEPFRGEGETQKTSFWRHAGICILFPCLLHQARRQFFRGFGPKFLYVFDALDQIAAACLQLV